MSNNGDMPQDFLVFQVDLSCHTTWLIEKERLKHYPKKELAKSIIDKLKDYGFDRCSWSGDGGFFIGDSEVKKDYDFVVKGADAVYDLFEKWKKDYSALNTQILDMRISVDIIPIIIDEYLGFCTSGELNDFLKHERTYTENGFSIGDQIKNKLSAYRDRFTWEESVGSPYKPKKMWFDSKHKSKERIEKEKTGKRWA